MAWREGEQVGPYQIQTLVGQGGMATVYKAYHAQLDRTVAIKVMHQMLLDEETFVARFKREAMIVARLDHPYIIPVYDYNEHEGQPYLVMKYVPGITLKQRLMKKGPLPLNDILSIMNSVGSALSYAHTKGVLHRDVKPSNIVLDGDVPYLTDFGLARIAEAGESTMSSDMVLGTPHYISPEQASGRKDIDGRADIYSLGVVLYELLVGRVPFTADTAYAIIHDQIYTPIPRPSLINPEIPQAVEDVLIRAAEKKPEDRYATVDDMMRDLKTAIDASNLKELSADRASAASESLAKYRSEFGGGFGMPSTTVGQPLPTGAYRTATVYQTKADPRQSRAWMIGGCGTFILICLIIGGLALSSLSYFLELQELTARASANGSEARPSFQFTFNQTGSFFSQADSESDLFTFLTMGDEMDTVQLLQEPDTSFLYMTEAARTWPDDPAASYASIAEGKDNTTDVVRYLMVAAVTADGLGDTDAALVYATIALYEAQKDPEKQALYTMLRPIAGKYLYETPAKDMPEDREILKQVAGTMYDEADIQQIQESPFGHFLKARVLLLAGNDSLARVEINAQTATAGFDAEIKLLRGEILAAQDKMGAAKTLWNDVALDESAPKWVKTQAQNHLTENGSL
jgi:serine/threonine protein kinase